MKRRPNFVYLQLIFLLAAMFLTAYSTYATITASAISQVESVSAILYEDEGQEIKTKEPDVNTILEFSKKVSDHIKTVEGVSDSSCFVMYDQCFAAIKCSNLVMRDAINKTKKEVEKSVLGKFEQIKAVHVTNDMNAFVKMQNIEKRLIAGEKITDMKEDLIELRKIFKRPKQFKQLKKRK